MMFLLVNQAGHTANTMQMTLFFTILAFLIQGEEQADRTETVSSYRLNLGYIFKTNNMHHF
jgi:hypothetical protein